jgi:steroid delta-isomerase-like uncharacterized protein
MKKKPAKKTAKKTEKKPKQVMTEWLSYMNSHELDKLAALYHEDAYNIQVAMGIPLEGRDAIRKDFEAFFKHNPDTFTEVENLFADGEWAVLEWTGGGTFHPDGRPATKGKRVALRGCGIFHIVKGKIKFQRGYWDKATWFEQVGISPNTKRSKSAAHLVG